MIREDEVLKYHEGDRAGKIEVIPSKPCLTQRDLSLAYTPGVAIPCERIEKNPEDAYLYTAKGNLVAVITNGTAVLGLGDIGPLAGKPVMEGKGVLFKRFADIDVFDIEVKAKDPDEFIRVVQALEPTFGGINLEDIKAPDCFRIEETLERTMNIPVFHDDQHGTAIISGAALLNALDIAGKKFEDVTIVFSGAGAAAIATANIYVELGADPSKILLVDRSGVVYEGRDAEINSYKARYVSKTKKRTLAEALDGADVFVGLSVKGLVSQDMVRSMSDNPIVFAMSNPDPEISYDDALAARPDVIMATGRSDYPNQVNNVLGFPFIFRGALDVRARAINMEMKLAAVRALAELAREDVPETVLRAYGEERIRFGREYIIPKPFDPRVLLRVSPAVAAAAVKSGVARIRLDDVDAYRDRLELRLGRGKEIFRAILHKARKDPKRIVLPEGDEERILRAAAVLHDEGIARPILLGDPKKIAEKAEKLDIRSDDYEVIHPRTSTRLNEYADAYYGLRQRKGIALSEARLRMANNRNLYGTMMVHLGDADGLISGANQHYPDVLRPILEVIRLREGFTRTSGLYMLVIRGRAIFFADTTVNIDPTADELAEIAVSASDMVRRLDIEPRVAMLSFSNFGSTRHPYTEKVARATELARAKRPSLIIDGEMQADTAVDPEIVANTYAFSSLKGAPANVLVFPGLESGNIAYKLMMQLGGADAIGPILLGMSRAVHVLQRGCSVNDIVNMAAIAVVDAQENARPRRTPRTGIPVMKSRR